jgi:hypothetical protein
MGHVAGSRFQGNKTKQNKRAGIFPSAEPGIRLSDQNAPRNNYAD